jgi:hypothetical protein
MLGHKETTSEGALKVEKGLKEESVAELVGLTEGYTPGDLKDLIDKAIQTALIQRKGKVGGGVEIYKSSD